MVAKSWILKAQLRFLALLARGGASANRQPHFGHEFVTADGELHTGHTITDG